MKSLEYFKIEIFKLKILVVIIEMTNAINMNKKMQIT